MRDWEYLEENGHFQVISALTWPYVSNKTNHIIKVVSTVLSHWEFKIWNWVCLRWVMGVFFKTEEWQYCVVRVSVGFCYDDNLVHRLGFTVKHSEYVLVTENITLERRNVSPGSCCSNCTFILKFYHFWVIALISILKVEYSVLCGSNYFLNTLKVFCHVQVSWHSQPDCNIPFLSLQTS